MQYATSVTLHTQHSGDYIASVGFGITAAPDSSTISRWRMLIGLHVILNHHVAMPWRTYDAWAARMPGSIESSTRHEPMRHPLVVFAEGVSEAWADLKERVAMSHDEVSETA
jgi:hypothetical protein